MGRDVPWENIQAGIYSYIYIYIQIYIYIYKYIYIYIYIYCIYIIYIKHIAIKNFTVNCQLFQETNY